MGKTYRLRAALVAVVAAVLGALSGIALGSWLAWRSVPPMLPGEATVLGVAHSVLPGPFEEHVDYYVHQTFWNPYSEDSLHGGTGVRAGRAVVSGPVPAGTTPDQLAAAVQERMRTEGWRGVHVGAEWYGPQAPGPVEVTGERAGYLVAVQITHGDQYNPATLRMNLMWAEPPGHRRDTAIGGGAGALFGAALALWTERRTRRLGRRRAYTWLALATLLALAPAALGNIPTASGSMLASTDRDSTGPAVYWGGFVIYGAEPLAMLSLAPLLTILVLCLRPARPAPPAPAPGPPVTPERLTAR